MTQVMDGLTNPTNYTYDPFHLFVATSTNALSQQTQYYYDYSLGKPKRPLTPMGGFRDDLRRADRPTAETQPDLGNPGTLVTKKTYAYTDTQGSRSLFETNYLDASTSYTVYTYLDGMDRPIQTRREAESPDTFVAHDIAYNELGQTKKDSLHTSPQAPLVHPLLPQTRFSRRIRMIPWAA